MKENEKLEELIGLITQPILEETEISSYKDNLTYLRAHQQIQSNVLSNYNATIVNASIDLSDQQILDSLINYQTRTQNEFDEVQIKYSYSNEAVQKLVQQTQKQTEQLKPTSENIDKEFKQFQEESQKFYSEHYQTNSSDVVDHQGIVSRNHQAEPSNSLLGSISHQLKWLNELGRIKLWFQILSDFHCRTNKLHLDKSNSNADSSVASTCQFNSLAEEICQIIVAFQDLSHDTLQFQSSPPSSTICFNLFNYVYQIVQNSIHSIIQFLCNHLSQILDDYIDWPKPSRTPLDFTSSHTNYIVDSCKAVVNFLNILKSRPDLISFDADGGEDKCKKVITVLNLSERSILLKAFTNPIVLRFRFHFDSGRPTNRLDRPEWYFNHILDRLAEHERFLKTDVQKLFNLSGEGLVDVFFEFAKQLIKLVERKLKRSVPQILEMKPILAHTIESAIQFDCAIKENNYLSIAVEPKPNHYRAGSHWLGTVDAILSNPDWFRTWFEAEKGFVDDVYLEIVTASDTWEINEEDRRPIEMKIPGTISSIRIQEVIEQIKEKYFKLPKLNYQIEFLMNLQIQILENYAQRIHGILDGFDKNASRFISVVGSTDSSRSKIFTGFTGLERLVKVYISSNWIIKNLQSWNDDLFYAELYENLKRDKQSFGEMSAQVDKLINSIESVGGLDVCIFTPLVKRFEELSRRAEVWIVRQVVQELSSELKPYLLKRWDLEQLHDAVKSHKETEEEMELSEEIIKPISIWKSRMSYLAQTIKPFHKLKQLIKTISKEIENKLISKIILDPFTIRSISLLGARQFQFDLIYGWLNFELVFVDKNSIQSNQTRSKVIKPEVFFGKLLDCCKLLSFHSSSFSGSISGGKTIEFNDLVQLCFKQGVDDGDVDLNDAQSGREIEFKKALKDLFHVSSLSKSECQSILKRRPECWKS